MFHARILKEINLISSQDSSSGCTNEFRPYVSHRLKLINWFQVLLNKTTALFVFATKNYITMYKPNVIVLDNNNYFVKNLDAFEACFNMLSDEKSRQRYISYIAYQYVKSYSTRLPFDKEEFARFTTEFERLPYNAEKGLLEFNFFNNVIFLPKSIYGLVINYKLEQYAYKDWLRVEKGDVVLDCGGADGDTAIYFAACGAKKVYSFEFLEKNINNFDKNLSSNSSLANNISLVNKALWDKAGVQLAFEDKGNASTVSELSGDSNMTVETITIDQFLECEGNRVDFIKMDIEGAELKALQGAMDSIKKYHPKLAICVYHKDTDLIEIPKFINDLGLGYNFMFDYYTDTGAEAVLYAKI
ncbi:FkbM family methyltransferase [Pseudoalteromonas sp. MMG012]|uniref:FkbM family methyltransferase n=1 Tax=Pseudoalteromonas sp. MMG012 TaxID=2822686 RepID=UPI001B3A11AB|nr:FkbM family methyltransferase [Pseudoalteromonas sp. MMG012]MBQ4849015.1 FkbM family methyltransferase [Pseudoalteromonas sp. MMG012]